jgi:HAD superfamily hydrolase (TIGR01509 family)
MSALLLGSISALADTSELQREAFNTAFAEHGLDWEWGQEDYQQMLTGNGGRDRVAAYAAERGEQVDADAVHATKSRIFQERLRSGSVSARPGVAETISAARAAGHKVALVTTTSADNLAALDAGLGGLPALRDFDLVVDGDQVRQGKPDPEAYRFALEKLGEDATDCVAVEDNVGGVEAARAAGIPVVAFPNTNTAGHDFGDVPRHERLDHDALWAVSA